MDVRPQLVFQNPPKSFKIDAKMPSHVDFFVLIDFWTILIHFGRHVGVEHRPKNYPKRHRKSDEKRRSPRGHKKAPKQNQEQKELEKPRCGGVAASPGNGFWTESESPDDYI